VICHVGFFGDSRLCYGAGVCRIEAAARQQRGINPMSLPSVDRHVERKNAIKRQPN